jgi:TonB family protein
LPPQSVGRRAFLAKGLLTLVFSSLAFLPQATALQNPGQVEINEAGRKIKKRVAPEYTELAQRLRVQGTARVQFTVTPDGGVKDVHELGGHPLLLESLVRAVKQWKYEPSIKETTVEVRATFTP